MGGWLDWVWIVRCVKEVWLVCGILEHLLDVTKAAANPMKEGLCVLGSVHVGVECVV